MHGRLKIKTTAEQEAEKKKERAVKQKKYLTGLNAVYKKRKENIFDQEALSLTAQLLVANPDVLTLWNFRREVLLNFKRDLDEKEIQALLEEELQTIEYCLVKNPKSYGGWHHRGWVLQVMPIPSYDKELQLCDRYFQKDDRNFHCWDHRRLIVGQSDRSLSEELTFTEDLINQNFSNYSAWHYRSKLLPVLHPAKDGCPHPIAEDVFLTELSRVVTAVFTDPSDQSPWFFLQWLLGKREQSQRLLQVGLTTIDEQMTLVLVFAKEVKSHINLLVYVDEVQVTTCSLQSHEDKHIWLLGVEAIKGNHDIRIRCSEPPIELTVRGSIDVGPMLPSSQNGVLEDTSLSEKTTKCLLEIKDSCEALESLDPGNKWVLLTLVNILASLGVSEHQEKILCCLDQLETIDPLRGHYYKDLRSKLIVEEKVKKALRENWKHLDLSQLSLTRIVDGHRLCFAQSLDLRGNRLRSLNGLRAALGCERLLLDGNPLQDLSPLTGLRRLKELSINGCGLRSFSQLEYLKDISSLAKLAIMNNDDGDEVDDFEAKVRSLIPGLVDLNC